MTKMYAAVSFLSVAIFLELLVNTAAQTTDVQWTWIEDSRGLGPSHWSTLTFTDSTGAPQVNSCGGVLQSPINLTSGMRQDPALCPSEITFYSGQCTLADLSANADDDHWEIDGFAECVDPPYITVSGVQWDLSQFHLHSVSEHTMGGGNGAGEVHMVHTNADGATLVMAFLVTLHEYMTVDNQVLAPYWTLLEDAIALANINTAAPTTSAPTTFPSDLSLAVYDMTPPSADYFTYAGSLTAPPCTEGVTWVIFAEKVVISPNQLDIMRTFLSTQGKADQYGNNNRPVQPNNGRPISRCFNTAATA